MLLKIFDISAKHIFKILEIKNWLTYFVCKNMYKIEQGAYYCFLKKIEKQMKQFIMYSTMQMRYNKDAIVFILKSSGKMG